MLVQSGDAQLLQEKEESSTVQTFPAGELFHHEDILDLHEDAEGVIWLLARRDVFYLLNEGVYSYEHFPTNPFDNIVFLKDDPLGRNLILCADRIIEIHGISSAPSTYHLGSLIDLDTERVIIKADFDTDGSLLILLGSDDTRELLRIDSQFTEVETLITGMPLYKHLHAFEDRILLSGKGLGVIWKGNEGPLDLELKDLSNLRPSAQQGLKIVTSDEDRSYLGCGEERVFIYDLKKDSVYPNDYNDRIEYFWLDDKGDLIILDKESQLRDIDGNVILQIKDERADWSERQHIALDRGSQGHAIGSNTWLTSAEGLYLINNRTSPFDFTRIEQETERVTNVLQDSLLDRVFALTSFQGLFIYELSSGKLLKHILKDKDGRRIEGFKWRKYRGQLYIYSLNAFYRFDKAREEFEFLLDPKYLAETTLPNRFNTMEVHQAKGEFILGTKDNHIVRYNPDTGAERLYQIIPEEDSPRNLIYEIDILHDGRAIVLAEQGFYLLDLESDELKSADSTWTNLPRQGLPGLSGLQVISDSTLLISSFGNGLMVFDFNKDSLYRPIANAFGNSDISDIFYDGLDHAYACSREGLLSYHIPSNTCRLIHIDKGLNSQNIHYRYMVRGEPGEMYLGLIDSYLHFKSEAIQAQSSDNIIIHRLDINGSPYTEVFSSENPLNLDYTSNNLKVEVGSPMMDHQARTIYQVRLLGLHDDWRIVPFGSPIRYDALAPGAYEMEIKDVNAEQVNKSLKFKISKPFWKKAWFILSLLIGVGLIMFVFYRLRLNYLQKESRLKAAHQLELAQLEMKSLRAQMNPHFLFNSLNSIKSFIAQNEPRIATRYLTKFSHLIRLILNNSRESRVSLEQELKALELYIELEQLRFEHSFDYSFRLDPLLNAESIMVPPLIVQPYVENAIWHGLLHKEGERKLEIEVQGVSDGIVMTIRDNGIGRDAAKQIKSKTATKHKSLGMTITADRISKVHEGKFTDGVKIQDLVDPAGDALGTEVQIHLPTQSA